MRLVLSLEVLSCVGAAISALLGQGETGEASHLALLTAHLDSGMCKQRAWERCTCTVFIKSHQGLRLYMESSEDSMEDEEAGILLRERRDGI